MFGSVMLEVVAAMGFLYLLMSLACSALNELIASALRLRARDLAAGVRSLLGSEAKRRKLYEHALIKSLVRDSNKKIDPSYIPSRTFALALLDQLAREGAKRMAAPPVPPPPDEREPLPVTAPMRQIQAGIELQESPELAESLGTLIREAGEDLKALQAGVERWFNDTMDRAGGWYKRKVQMILLSLALILTIGLNADTVMIGNALLRDATLRSSIVAAAEQYAGRASAEGEPVAPSLDTLRAQLGGLQLPIGWSYEWTDEKQPLDLVWWLTKILGLAITAMAVSLGAPFWFDVLNRVTKLRGSGTKPDHVEQPKTEQAGSG